MPTFTGRRGRRYAQLGLALQTEIENVLGPRGILLYPPYSHTAPRHGRPLLTPLHFVYTAIFNVLELPATAVPLGLNEDGRPLGVQIVSARRQDALTIAAALELERAFGGWVPPPMLCEL